jgi:hypothetical protein
VVLAAVVTGIFLQLEFRTQDWRSIPMKFKLWTQLDSSIFVGWCRRRNHHTNIHSTSYKKIGWNPEMFDDAVYSPPHDPICVGLCIDVGWKIGRKLDHVDVGCVLGWQKTAQTQVIMIPVSRDRQSQSLQYTRLSQRITL